MKRIVKIHLLFEIYVRIIYLEIISIKIQQQSFDSKESVVFCPKAYGITIRFETCQMPSSVDNE